MPSTSAPLLPSPEVLVHLTHSFAADLAILQEQPRSADATLQYLTKALQQLKDQISQDTLPISPYGKYGDSFIFVLNDEFAFTYKRVTDRDSERRPITFHYYLKNLLRRT